MAEAGGRRFLHPDFLGGSFFLALKNGADCLQGPEELTLQSRPLISVNSGAKFEPGLCFGWAGGARNRSLPWATEKVCHSRTGHVKHPAAGPAKQLRRKLNGFKPGDAQLSALDSVGRALGRVRRGGSGHFVLCPACKLMAAQTPSTLAAWKWLLLPLAMAILQPLVCLGH